MPDLVAQPCRPDREAPPRRIRRFAPLAVVLLTIGCGDGGAEKRRAYAEAVAAVEREKLVLRNMQIERDRLFGEYLMHDFESRAWSGQISLPQLLGVQPPPTEPPDGPQEFLRRHWPAGWRGQLRRLVDERPELLPWYDRYAGDAYRRKLNDRYARLLKDLADRVLVQQGRVRDAEEYARIIKPPDAE